MPTGRRTSRTKGKSGSPTREAAIKDEYAYSSYTVGLDVSLGRDRSL
jgi:hypothetical protein